MKITVTKRHIDLAKKAETRSGYDSSLSCPIAKAVKEKLHKSVEVTNYSIVIRQQGGSRWLSLPKIAQRFINRFDMGKPVKPFTFFTK